MPDAFSTRAVTAEGFPAIRLESPGGELTATFCPTVGMVGASLQHRGAELLGLRGGLARYELKGSTLGIPLLHPWANRLSGFEYEVAGRRVELDPDNPLLHLDPAGLPIHGVLAGSSAWRDIEASADDAAARLSARLDFGAHPELLDAFPFPHELAVDVALDARSLTISTQLAATGDVAVPVAFGYHPYLRLPVLPRAEWEIGLPPLRRLVLDERMLPTGAVEDSEPRSGALGRRHFDDAFCDLPPEPRFTLSGGGRTVAVEFLEGFSFAQLYAPAGDEVVCFEPMTAATNALVAGGPGLKLVEPGDRFTARFRFVMS